MKKSIIYLGILSTVLVNTLSANEIISDQQNIENEIVRTESKSNLISNSNSLLEKPEIKFESESKIKESIAVISSNYVKSIEEVIEENKKIIESQEEEYLPLNLGFSVEEIIHLDNQIIESTISNEVYPLDFEVINSKKAINTYEFKCKEVLKS
jgi:hypothetical protein